MGMCLKFSPSLVCVCPWRDGWKGIAELKCVLRRLSWELCSVLICLAFRAASRRPILDFDDFGSGRCGWEEQMNQDDFGNTVGQLGGRFWIEMSHCGSLWIVAMSSQAKTLFHLCTGTNKSINTDTHVSVILSSPQSSVIKRWLQLHSHPLLKSQHEKTTFLRPGATQFRCRGTDLFRYFSPTFWDALNNMCIWLLCRCAWCVSFIFSTWQTEYKPRSLMEDIWGRQREKILKSCMSSTKVSTNWNISSSVGKSLLL